MHIKSLKMEVKKSKAGYLPLTTKMLVNVWAEKDDILLESEQRVRLSHDNDWNPKTKYIVVAGVMGQNIATVSNLRVILCQDSDIALSVWDNIYAADKDKPDDDPTKIRLLSARPTGINIRKELDEETARSRAKWLDPDEL